MNRHLATLLLLLVLSMGAKAQYFRLETHYITAGYGFGSFIQAIQSEVDDVTSTYSTSATGPVYLKYEHALTGKFGIGVAVAYANFGFDYTEKDASGTTTYSHETDYTTFSILARMNWHFAEKEGFDPYIGVGLGYRDGNWTYKTNDPDGSDEINYSVSFPFGFETTIGARIRLSGGLSAYTEIGLAKSVVQLGLTQRIGR